MKATTSSYGQTVEATAATVARIEAAGGRAANRQAAIADLLREITRNIADGLSGCGTRDIFGETITPESVASGVIRASECLAALSAMTEDQWRAEYRG